MMWFKRDPKVEKVENGVVGKLRRKKAVLLKPTRESERETSTESEKDKRRYSDILDMKVSQERRDESDESLYESADCHSDAISASDDALPRLGKTPTMSKESLKLAVTDEEVDLTKNKKGHRKTMSLSNPLEIVKTLGDEWFDNTKKELDKNCDKKKSRESLWSEEDNSIHGSNVNCDQVRKNSKKEDSSQSNSRKSSTVEPPKSRKSSKGSSVSALNFLRRKKTPTSTLKAVEAVNEVIDKLVNTQELVNYTKVFLEEEKRYSGIRESKPIVETDSDEELPTPKPSEQRRRLSRQTSRSKSKVRGKSQSVKVNTLRKSHSGTLKKSKKKSMKVGTPLAGRSRQASIVEQTPLMKKKHNDTFKQNSWLFSGSRGEPRREGSTEEPPAPDAEDAADTPAKEPDKDNNWRAPAPPSGRGVNRAESCRERDAPRRGKHRNASDPNRLTAHNHHDLEPGAAPSGSSSSSSLSSRSNESNTAAVGADQQASQSDWSEEDEPLAAQWADSLPPHAIDSLLLSARLRKRQEVIHELIVSEGSHVRWLKVLGTVFLRPLEGQASLLPSDELRALFPNLPGVRERHCKLYAELRAVRNDTTDHVVQIRPIADAMLSTLGEPGYGACLSRFCRGQRMALDALRERRRKSKELHQFLAAREQLPLCGRLQLRDLLACVWQRLTKYQLLLESILKTVSDVDSECEADGDSADDVLRLKRALDTAKDVLQSVDQAIRTSENEHRLRTIQSKLEVRVPSTGAEWEEPRRLDLTQRRLRMEGELSIRNDSNKKMTVLALMLEDSLVLLQREGDKFVLRPIPQPSQQGLLSPLVKWERVLFRPNAAVRHTFFLMNINGVQMHELSANTNAEYTSWVKHMQELPLAKPELKPSLTPSHQASRSTDDSGINVSRNPSDASEKSTSTVPDEPELERDRVSLERSSTERERDDKRSAEREREDKGSVEREERRSVDAEETSGEHTPRRPTVGRISTHGAEAAPALLEPGAALTVRAPAAAHAHTAHRAYTHQERLRRLDLGISRALSAKSVVVGELLGLPPDSFAHMADLAVEDARGGDVCGALRLSRLSRGLSGECERDGASVPDMHQLLLAAQAQANQLTESLSGALSVSEAALVSSRVSRGHCDTCRPRPARRDTDTHAGATAGHTIDPVVSNAGESIIDLDAETRLIDLALAAEGAERPHEARQWAAEGDALEALDASYGAAALASRLVSPACGVQAALARLLGALPALEAERRAARAELAALREDNDKLRARCNAGYPPTDEISFPKEGVDQAIQDHPSNGG